SRQEQRVGPAVASRQVRSGEARVFVGCGSCGGGSGRANRSPTTTTGDELRCAGEEFDTPVTYYSAAPEASTRHPRPEPVTRRPGRGSAQLAPRSVPPARAKLPRPVPPEEQHPCSLARWPSRPGHSARPLDSVWPPAPGQAGCRNNRLTPPPSVLSLS